MDVPVPPKAMPTSGSEAERVPGGLARFGRGVIGAIGLATAAASVCAGKAIAPASQSVAMTRENYAWRPVAIGGGGFITGLSFDQTGQTLVARADVYGAYVWDRQADRWEQLVTAASMPRTVQVQNGIAEGAYEIVVAPSRSTRLYMAIRGHVYRSDDRGRSWRNASQGNPFPLAWDGNSEYRLSGPFLAVDPSDPDLVFLGTPANGLWRSADGGNNWTRVGTVASSVARSAAGRQKAPGILVWFEPSRDRRAPGRILAMAQGRQMLVSQDRGHTFAPLSAQAVQPTNLRRGTFDRHGTFFGVDDVARTVWSYAAGRWRNVGQEAGLAPALYGAIAADPHADRIIALDQGGAGYQSRDGGKTWSIITHRAAAGPEDPPWLRVSDSSYFSTAEIVFDPVVRDRVWVASGTGVFFADLPAGSSRLDWISRTRGIEELVANDVVQGPGQAPVFAGWDFGMHVKPDLERFSTTFAPAQRALMSVAQVDWTPADPAFLVSNASDARLGCCSEDGNAVMAGTSSDGGRTWTKFAGLPTPPGTRPDDPWRMMFGSIAVSASDPDNIVWVPAMNRQPYFTTDRGRTWFPVRLPGAIGDYPGSFSTYAFPRKSLASDKAQGGTFYMVHSGDAPNPQLAGLWRSADGGAHWQRVYTGEIAPASSGEAKLRAVPGKGGHLFFSSSFAYTTDTRLRRSTDGGRTWKALDDVTRVDDIAFGKAAPGASYPAIYISGRVTGLYGVWRSLDDARSWQRLAEFPLGSLDQVTTVGADPDVFGRVYLGYKGSGWIWGEPAACGNRAPASKEPHCTQVQ